jgi:nitroimidazol reductase NimA-like FMN-containing flavoprotein (pyridoxamine 5'-phosphate oxidase superfamily)
MQMATTSGSAGRLPGAEPLGVVPAAVGRELQALSPEECLGLLEPGGVGRVGFTSLDGVVILPVNFAVVGKTVIIRTGPDTLLAAHANEPVSFESDRFDEAGHDGWSVLIQGHAHKVASEDGVRHLAHVTHLEPWAGGARDVYVRITPVRISGRRIRRAIV